MVIFVAKQRQTDLLRNKFNFIKALFVAKIRQKPQGRIYATLPADRIACYVITYRTRLEPGRHEWRPYKIVGVTFMRPCLQIISRVFCGGRIHATLAADRIAGLRHYVSHPLLTRAP